MINSVKIILLGLMFTSTAMASGGHDRGHGYGHHKHHHKHHHHPHYREYRAYYPPVERVYYREEVRYYPERVVRYEAVPQYQPVPPRHDYYDRRTTGGLVGGALGSVVGYEIGRGDPIAAGIGAAAGSLIGNEIRR